MRVLVAEDDPVFIRLLHRILEPPYDVIIVTDGQQAWHELTSPTPPRIAVVDWMMPLLDGLDLCRRVRASESTASTYILLLTARRNPGDVVVGLEAGADDYITKPFNPDELRARIRVGERIVALEDTLALRVGQLQDALANVKVLQGLLPICSYCKRIRNDQDYWEQLESYVSEHSRAMFTHSICPDCFQEQMKPQLDEARRRR